MINEYENYKTQQPKISYIEISNRKSRNFKKSLIGINKDLEDVALEQQKKSKNEITRNMKILKRNLIMVNKCIKSNSLRHMKIMKVFFS